MEAGKCTIKNIKGHTSKATSSNVVALHHITLGDAPYLWEAVKKKNQNNLSESKSAVDD